MIQENFSSARPFPSHTTSKASTIMTRRQMLRTLALSSAAVVGGVALSSCGAQTGNSTTVNVTLYTTGWPFDILPSKTDQQKDTSLKAYADTLSRWFSKNPGVTIKKSMLNVWDVQALTTAVSSGTAPTWYPGNVLGAWYDSKTRSAFLHGMSAEVTPLLDHYQINDTIAPYVKPLWSRWSVNGKYYAAPASYNVGNGVYYRRDLIQQLGLKEPQPGWTWEDFRMLAHGLTSGKRKGAAMEGWTYSAILEANGFSLLTQVPSPKTSWHWHYDYTSNAQEWIRDANLYRTMRYQDQSILAVAGNAGTNASPQSFANQNSAMFIGASNFFTMPDTDPGSITAVAKNMGKTEDEVVGWVQMPAGSTGAFGGTQPFIVLLSFDPRLARNAVGLDKAVSIFAYMQFGQGAIDQKVSMYQATKDLRKVFTDVPSLTGLESIPGVPGTASDAWGTRYVQAIKTAANIPVIPIQSWYFPAETNADLTTDAANDFGSGVTNTHNDIMGLLQHRQQIENAQAQTLVSVNSQDTFIKSARTYYTAVGDFWQQNAPLFYSSVYLPWYQRNVLPAIGQ